VYRPGHGSRPDAATLTDPDPMAWASDLFDAGRYWAAHEVWESLWAKLPRDSDEARFYQGLILVSASLLKHSTGSAEAASSLFARAVEIFEGLIDDGDVIAGVDVLELVASVDHALHGGPSATLTNG
jgi:predicted metal-dependent hydrolase